MAVKLKSVGVDDDDEDDFSVPPSQRPLPRVTSFGSASLDRQIVSILAKLPKDKNAAMFDVVVTDAEDGEKKNLGAVFAAKGTFRGGKVGWGLAVGAAAELKGVKLRGKEVRLQGLITWVLAFLMLASAGAAEPVRGAPGQRKCGVERWDVKTAQDGSASRLDIWPTSTSVRDLAAIPMPAPKVKGKERRGVWPEEFQTFSVEGRVAVAKPEPDSDVHIAIEDGSPDIPETLVSMIVEVVHPECAGPRPWRAIVAARQQLVEMIGGEPTKARLRTLLGRWVRVSGVAFFDKLHGQKGGAPNGIELHPVMSIAWVVPSPAPAPSPSAMATR